MQSNQIELVHLQLTRKCNLRCRFCGQWGDKGFASSDKSEELSENEWLDAIAQINSLPGVEPEKVKYVLWGGEPLLSEAFAGVVRCLKEYGSNVAVVTNGTMLSENYQTINDYVDTLYVSIDGPEKIHEEIRGLTGIYNKISEGLSLIDKSEVKLIGMFTLCEKNYKLAENFPYTAAELGFSELIYQNLIYCYPQTAETFKGWLVDKFTLRSTAVDSWVTDGFGEWVKELPAVICRMKDNAKSGAYSIRVNLYPDCWMNENVSGWFRSDNSLPEQGECGCQLPHKHLHIRANGSLDFCVDHSDMSLGNLRVTSLIQILESEKAGLFRQEIELGHNPLCRRCPWFYNKSLGRD